MIYTQDVFLNRYCKKVRQEPFRWSDLFKPIKFHLPENKIIDMDSLKLIGRK